MIKYFWRFKLLIFCLITLLSCNLFSEYSEKQEVLSTVALNEDFNILRKTLEEAHPGFYWYTDKAAMNHFFDSIKTLFDHDMSSLAFYKILLPVIANIKCSHTNIRLPKETNSASLLVNLLPFDFFCQNGKVFIRKNLIGKGYEGNEIVSINNIETKEIIKTLLKMIPADGNNETFKYHILNAGAFREGYALYYGQPTRFTFQSYDHNNQLYSFTLPGVPPQKQIPLPEGPTPFVLNFHHKTAILTVNTFQLNRKSFSDSVASLFALINNKGAKNLIIDVRKNGGGLNDNVSTLYSYIASAPFLHLKRAEMNATPLTYTRFIINPKSIEDFPTTSNRNGTYEVNDKYAGTTTKLPATKNLFKGDVVLLTSGSTSSAASEFVAITRHLKRAKIIGDETGGCYYGTTGGNFIKLRLPNSGFELSAPTMRILNAVDEDFVHQPKGRGTFPDYPVSPTLKDIITGNDVQLKTALKILRN